MTQPFRLQSILNLRQRERDQAGKEVAEAKAAIALLDAKLAEIQSQDLAMEQLRRRASDGLVDLNQVLDAERYQWVLAAQKTHLLGDRTLLNEELERRQARLVLRQQALKAMEKLEQRHWNREDELEIRREQSRLDEWSQMQYAAMQRREL